MELLGKYTVFAEGARGHLGKQLLARFKLTEGRDPQTFAIGIKELWEIPPTRRSPAAWCTPPAGRCSTTASAAASSTTWKDNQVTLGFVIGLDYQQPAHEPVRGMQRWKTHPAIRAHIEGGKRIGYGARAINNGTPQALPKTVFPGGALVGCDAGYLNAARIKGSHAAIKSGMLCAEALAAVAAAGRVPRTSSVPTPRPSRSWLHEELQQTRNFKLWFKKGKAGRAADDRHRAVAAAQARRESPPWTLHNHKPTTRPAPAANARRSPTPSPTASSASTACPRCSSPTPTTKSTSRRT
jgi:electron-transferring-flavoprotein dehydrogenase